MSISDTTRKRLWGNSGNCCAYCHCKLVIDATENDPEAIIGEECHIIAQSPNGPRGTTSYEGDLDGYDNLLLLCSVHHTMIDKQPNTYTVEALRKLKAHHEKWVQKRLNTSTATNQNANSVKEISLTQIKTGKELLSLLASAHSYATHYDEPDNRDELDLISNFISKAIEWGEFADDFDQKAFMLNAFDLNDDLKDLNNAGFYVYGKRQVSAMVATNSVGERQIFSDWQTAYLSVIRHNLPVITMKLDPS